MASANFRPSLHGRKPRPTSPLVRAFGKKRPPPPVLENARTNLLPDSTVRAERVVHEFPRETRPGAPSSAIRHRTRAADRPVEIQLLPANGLRCPPPRDGREDRGHGNAGKTDVDRCCSRAPCRAAPEIRFSDRPRPRPIERRDRPVHVASFREPLRFADRL